VVNAVNFSDFLRKAMRSNMSSLAIGEARFVPEAFGPD